MTEPFMPPLLQLIIIVGGLILVTVAVIGAMLWLVYFIICWHQPLEPNPRQWRNVFGDHPDQVSFEPQSAAASKETGDVALIADNPSKGYRARQGSRVARPWSNNPSKSAHASAPRKASA